MSKLWCTYCERSVPRKHAPPPIPPFAVTGMLGGFVAICTFVFGCLTGGLALLIGLPLTALVLLFTLPLDLWIVFDQKPRTICPICGGSTHKEAP